jgi:glycosidase
MIWLRKKTPALREGDFVPIPVESDRALVYLRETKSQKVLVALNFFEAPCDIRIGSTDLQGSWRVLLSSKRETDPQPVSNIIRLGPHEAAIWELT